MWEEECRRTERAVPGEKAARDPEGRGTRGRRSSGSTPLNLDWFWNDEFKVWIPERPQPPDDEELIGEMDLVQEMEKNFMKACRKIPGDGEAEGLSLRDHQRTAPGGKEMARGGGGWRQRHREQEEPRFQTPMDEIFVTPSASAPPPPPPPPPPRRAESKGEAGQKIQVADKELVEDAGGNQVAGG